MNQNKHICDLEYCKRHSQCIFRNAMSSLKSDSYIVSLGGQECSDRILCYQKEEIVFEAKPQPVSAVIKRIEDSDSSWSRELELRKNKNNKCENPKCYAVAEVNHRNKINLCNKCNEEIYKWKSHVELAQHFRHKNQIIKLLSVIDQLNNPIKETMIRCSNIYCGTDENITQHHLIPNPYRKGVAGGNIRIPLCEPCHRRVHNLKTNKQLALHYNTKSSVIQLLSEDVPFRVSRMMTVSNSAIKAKVVKLNIDAVPSGMELSEAGWGLSSVG